MVLNKECIEELITWLKSDSCFSYDENDMNGFYKFVHIYVRDNGLYLSDNSVMVDLIQEYAGIPDNSELIEIIQDRVDLMSCIINYLKVDHV